MGEHEEDNGYGDEMGLTDLAEAAGVSVRTVRYYITEGLLPPPLGAGPRAAYTAEHLDRLRLIARLKDAYLPLREIRRRLRGLDADAVRALLLDDAGGAAPRVAEAPEPPTEGSRRSYLRADRQADDSAAAYLSRLLPAPRRQQPSPAGPLPPAPEPPAPPFGKPADPPEQTGEQPSSRSGEPNDPAGLAGLTRADLDRGAALAALAALDAHAGPDAVPAEPVIRLRLGDDAELLVGADTYERRRAQIDALVAWARQILG